MTNRFPFLSIETSGELCGAAVFLDEKNYSEYNIRLKHVHSQKLLLMINEVLASVDMLIPRLKFIAISQGPGSFTGLRIGMAAAKGLAVGNNIPILPVPTFEAYAYKINRMLPAGTLFSIANNVNVEELYFAKYSAGGGKHQVLHDISLIKKTELNNYTNSNELIFGNQGKFSKLDDTPTAFDIGFWAYKFGEDLLISGYDFIEPKYLKEFVARTKK